MKAHSFLRRFSHYTLLVPCVLILVAWSPSGGDPQILLGTGGDLDGFTGSVHNQTGINVTAYKGFIGGYGNYVGTGYLGVAGGASRWNVLVGYNNVGNSQGSVIAGIHNVYAKSGTTADADSMRFSGLFGNYNVVDNGSASNVISGYGNTVRAGSSAVAGSLNTIEGSSIGTNCSYSAAFGLSNHVMAESGWAVGWGNTVSGSKGAAIGTSATASNESSTAIGTGVVASVASSTALGRYNDTMQSNDVVAIGTGSATTPFTALRLTDDGSVILGRAQGDISMGAYGN